MVSHVFDTRYVLLRNRRTHDQVLKLSILPSFFIHFHWLDVANYTSKLALAASLFPMRVIEFRSLRDCFAESHTRFAGSAVDVVFAPHALYIDFEMQFTHARYYCLLSVIHVVI